MITELIQNLNQNGVAYAIVCALSAWLGRLWAGRISASETSELERKITVLRSDLEREQRKLSGEIEKAVHVHRVQFEKEFAVYQEVMQAAEALRVAFFTLRRDLQPVFDDPAKRQEYLTPLRKCFAEHFCALRDIVHRNRPFFAPEVYTCCDRLLDLLTREIIHQDFLPLHGRDISFEEADRMKESTKTLIDGLSDSIRNRIHGVVVVE